MRALNTLPLGITLTALMLSAWPIMPARAQQEATGHDLSRQVFVQRRALCAAEWEKMKRAGSEGSLLWREFAESCMQRTDLNGQTYPQNENASPIR